MSPAPAGVRPAAGRTLAFAAPALAVLALDLATKALVFRCFDLHGRHAVIPGFLSITPCHNEGVAFGMMQWGGGLLLWLVPALLLGILWYAWGLRAGPVLDLACVGAIFGGALGNYLDRLRFGRVRDFLDVRLLSWDYPVFNLADAAISCGVAAMILAALWTHYRKPTAG